VASNHPQELRHRSTRVTPAEMKIWHRRLFERGWVAPDWPREHGGMGASLTQQIILFEEMTRIGAEPPYPHGLSFIGPIIIHSGTPEQKARFLPRILSGEDTWCQGYSEPEAGSDLASLKTSAQLVGDEFIVNGHKAWTTNGHYADWMFALVRTDPAAVPRHAGLSLLLIDQRRHGIRRGDFRKRPGSSCQSAGPAERRLAAWNSAAWRRALYHQQSGTDRPAPQSGPPRGAEFGRIQ
jgi:alkylation response protein AidB-like acyl-CoA dehydrogenase